MIGRRTFGLLLALGLWAVPVCAQVRTGPGTTLITPAGTSVMDEANMAVRVNCAVGCGAGGAAGTKIVDGAAAGEADVIGSAPTGTEQGLVVRPIPSGTQGVNLSQIGGTSQSGANVVDTTNSAFRVNVVAGGGSGGTSSSFGAAFPSAGTAAGYFDGTAMQGARVYDADTGAGTHYVLGTLLKKPASGGPVDFGTATDPIRVDPTGTTTQPVSGTVTATQGGSWTVTANAGTGSFNNASVGTVGGAPPSSATYVGVRSGGNLQPIIACDSSVAINTATAGTTQLVALTAGQTIYVCGWDFIANGTVTVKFVSGTGTACGTGTADLTGPYPLTAQAGLARGGGLGTIARAAVGTALCINLSAAVQVSGMVSYTKF